MSDGREEAPLVTLKELADRLLEAGTAGRFFDELMLAHQALDTKEHGWTTEEILHARLLFFDLALVSSDDRRLQAMTGVGLLGALDWDTWDAVLGTSRIDELRRLADEPELGLELIELLTYAPDPGLHDAATAQLEAIGIRRSLVGDDVRSIERLLHASGARDGAYRLEAARKIRVQRQHSGTTKLPVEPTRIPYRVIAIAGGHAQLRVSAAAVLESYGVRVVPIPSSREAVRRERGILQALQGCDLVMLLVRLITHSTSDQVRKAAERMGIPVLFSNAASAVAIERQLLEFGQAIPKE
jgi:hypothetical protein